MHGGAGSGRVDGSGERVPGALPARHTPTGRERRQVSQLSEEWGRWRKRRAVRRHAEGHVSAADSMTRAPPPSSAHSLSASEGSKNGSSRCGAAGWDGSGLESWNISDVLGWFFFFF